MKRLVTFMAVTCLTLGIPSLVNALPITATVTVDTETVLTIVGTGRPIPTSITTHFHDLLNDQAFVTSSGFWSIDFSVIETEKPSLFDPNDEVSIAGTIQHLLSPTGHGDGPGIPISFNFGVNANNASGIPQTVSKSVTDSKDHGTTGHKDNFTGFISANVITTLAVDDDITNYNFTLDVRHCSSPCPIADLTVPQTIPSNEIPEPSTFVLFGSVLIWLARLGLSQWHRLGYGSTAPRQIPA